MNKILILDDRVERKKTHLNNDAIRKLSNCVSRGLLTMITGEGVEKDKSFQYCSDYSLVAVHKSWLDANELTMDIEQYAKKKLLVIFSGGIGQTLLLNDYKYLRVNSADFYTNRLPDFIERYAISGIEQPLLQLLYGEAWRLPIYMKYRQLLWRGLSENDDEYIDNEINYGSYLEQFNAPTISEKLEKLDKSIKDEITKANAL